MGKGLLFIDTETTGTGPADRLCQIAYQYNDATPRCLLFKPPTPISFESMAVHHITNEMVAGRPAFADDEEFHKLRVLFEIGDILVAHNAKFDIEMLEKEGLKVGPSICTMKVMQSLDKEGKLSSYSMQYLRYRLGLKIPREHEYNDGGGTGMTIVTPHDALGDIVVLKQLFLWLKEKVSVERMIEITANPLLLAKVPLGQHKGKTFREVPKSYLQWMVGQDWVDGDLRHTANFYLNHE